MKLFRWAVVVCLFVACVTAAQAQVKMDGSFVAAKTFPAFPALKKGTKPGDVAG